MKWLSSDLLSSLSKFVYFRLPETANLTAPEIDEQYVNHKPAFPRKKWD